MERYVKTAGAYVRLDGLWLFVVGPTPKGDKLAVVRVGGHREGEETSWECAMREVREETGLEIEAESPQRTYVMEVSDQALKPTNWAGTAEEPAPAFYRDAEDGTRSVMYLATTSGQPVPSMEVKGLLMLRQQDVFRLTSESITLSDYLAAGGRAIFREEMPGDLPLEPYLQLRVLSELLKMKKEEELARSRWT